MLYNHSYVKGKKGGFYIKKTIFIMLIFSLIFSGIVGAPIVLAEGTSTITVNVTGNGTVMPGGTVTVENGETQLFTCIPDSGYVISDIKFNGTPVSVNANNEYTTPIISFDSVLEVTFSPKSIEMGISTYSSAFYSGPKSSITFGTVIDAIGFEIEEYGILCHETEEDITFDTPGVRVFPAINRANYKGQYGIELDNSLGRIGKNYYTRAYAIYKQGGVTLSPIYASYTMSIDEDNYVAPVEEDATLSAVSVDGGVLYPEFSPDVYTYDILFDELPDTIPSLEFLTTSPTTTATENKPESFSMPTTITTLSEGGAELTYTFNFRLRKTAVLPANHFGVKQYFAGSLLTGEIPSPVFKSYPENGGRVFNANYEQYSSYTLLNFNTSSITENNIKIVDATLTLKAMSDYTGGQYLEILRSTNTTWVTNPGIYSEIGILPAVGAEGVLNKGDCLVEYGDAVGNTESLYKTKTIPLKTEGFTDANSINLIYRTRYDSSIDNKRIFVWIGRNSNSSGIPTVTVAYYVNEPIMDNVATLSSLSVDGAESIYPAFDPNTKEYYALYNELPSEVPTITCTTTKSTAQYQVQSTDIGEKASVIVTAESGATETYDIYFRQIQNQTVNAKYHFIKKYWSDPGDVYPLPTAAYPTAPAEGLRAYNAEYSGASTRMYLDFDKSSLPDNITISAADLNLYAHTRTNTSMILEVYVCTDPAWVSGSSPYLRNTFGPALDLSNRLNKDECLIDYSEEDINAFTTFSPYSLELKPELLTSKDKLNFGLRALYTGDTSAQIYVRTRSDASLTPVITLDLSYFIK